MALLSIYHEWVPIKLKSRTTAPLTIKQYADTHGVTLEPVQSLVRVQGRRYTFARDTELQRVTSSALEARHRLLMEDVFRLIVGMNADTATGFARALFEARTPIFSIRHGHLITSLPQETVKANLGLHAGRFMRRSKAIRQGMAENMAPPHQAAIAGARARRRTANHRARRLYREIEKVRAALPETDRENRAAIARALNAAGIEGPGGGAWQGTTVNRIEDRAPSSLRTSKVHRRVVPLAGWLRASAARAPTPSRGPLHWRY